MATDPKVLSSWKEIACYFGKGVRTVQRWERNFGLPVRRAGRQDRHAVIAIPAELDVWIRVWKSGRRSELEDLRAEVAALRLENWSLRLAMDDRTGLPPATALHGDHDLVVRSMRLMSETAELGQYSKQLVAWSRTMRMSRRIMTVN